MEAVRRANHRKLKNRFKTSWVKMILELYKGEEQLPEIIKLIGKDLSEPYSTFTYRSFLLPKAIDEEKETSKIIGVIVCRAAQHKTKYRGYIAMLAVSEEYRKRGIASQLVREVAKKMESMDLDEIVLETESCNKSALALYQKLGFIKDKKLTKYYMNGNDAYRLKLYLK